MKVKIERFDLDEIWKPYSRPVWCFTVYQAVGNVYLSATYHDRWKAITLQQITPVVVESHVITSGKADSWRVQRWIDELISVFVTSNACYPVNPVQIEAVAAIVILVAKLVLDRVEVTFTV